MLSAKEKGVEELLARIGRWVLIRPKFPSYKLHDFSNRDACMSREMLELRNQLSRIRLRELFKFRGALFHNKGSVWWSFFGPISIEE